MASLSTPFRPSDIPTGLLAYWKLNNDATDSSGNGYNLTAVNSPTYSANANYWKDEYCGVSTAASKYWSLSNASATSLKLLNTDFTIFGWYKAGATTFGEIIGMNNVSSTGWWLYIVTNSTNRYMRFSTPGENTDLNGYGDIWDNVSKWIPFAITFNKTSKVICGYSNGNLVHTSTRTNGIGDTAGDFLLSDGATANLKDFAIWNTVLTPIQIKSLALGVDLSTFAYRPNNVSIQPTHWWKLNEISGTRADSVATNPLTLTDNNTVQSTGGYIEAVGAKNGGSEYLSSTHNTDLDFGTGDFTINSWMWWDTTADVGCANASKLTGTTGWLSLIAPFASNYWNFYNGSGILTVSFPATLKALTRYMFTIRRSGNNLQFFLDGIQVGATKDCTGRNYDGVANGFEVFAYEGGAAGTAACNQSDLAIWKGYAVTDAELKSLACAIPIQKQGIVSYWKMNETTGSRIDEVGGNNLTENNTVGYDTGLVGNCAYINDANNESLTVTSSTLAPTTDYTVAFLAKYETSSSYDNIYNVGPAYTGCIVRGVSTGAIQYCSGNTTELTGSYAPADGVWFSCIASYTNAQKNLWMKSSAGDSFDTAAHTTNPTDTVGSLCIGSPQGGGSDYFDGWIDEVLYFKRYFRPEEAKTLSLKGLHGKEATSTEISETSIKKVAGVAYASIKKISGVAIASIKKVAGVA